MSILKQISKIITKQYETVGNPCTKYKISQEALLSEMPEVTNTHLNIFVAKSKNT